MTCIPSRPARDQEEHISADSIFLTRSTNCEGYKTLLMTLVAGAVAQLRLHVNLADGRESSGVFAPVAEPGKQLKYRFRHLAERQ